jgi:Predicted N-acetylglucosaminyl transferase
MFKILLSSLFITSFFTSYSQADSSAFYYQKGLAEKQKGRRMESVKQFEKAYTYRQDDKALISELAAGYLDTRRYGQAREKFIQLEKMGDHSDSTYRQLMLLSFNMHQQDDAIKYALLLKKNNPDEKVAYYIAKANYDQENLGEAIKYFEFAAKEDPNNGEIPYTLARAYADMQNYKKAIPYFQKAIELKPDQTRWIYEMALIYYAMPDDANALKYLLIAADKGYKKDNEFLQNLGIAYLNNGKFDEGITTLKDLLQRRPSDMSIITLLAQGYYDAKKYDDAITYYDQLLQQDNKNAEALYMIGMCFQKKGQKEKGIALCDKAIQMDPSLQNLKQKKQLPGGL